MFTNSLSSTKNIYLSVLFTSIFCAALFFSQTTPASAQTGGSISELQAQIATLMARINALQAGGASNSSAGSGVGSSSSMRSYRLADVQSVTKQFVDPNKAIADEEYNLYVITLKSGRTSEVKVPVRTVPGTAEKAFRKAGYTGRLASLLARAAEAKKETATTTTAAPQVTLVAGNDRLVNATVVVARTLRPVVVTGPTALGTIAWGDGVTESLVGLITGSEMTVKVSHTYKKDGTYTVVVTDPNGKVTKETIEVKAGAIATTTPAAPRITLVAGKDGLYTGSVLLARPSQPRVVTGPTQLGTINWGDGVKENLNGLVTGNVMEVKLSHRYKTNATYTVSIVDANGKTASQSVIVKSATSTPVSRPTPFNGTVLGDSTNIYAEIMVTLKGISSYLDTLK